MEKLVYAKINGEQLVPVTVCVDWLPNGKIKPLMYRTPDNSCYEVKHFYNTVKLAFVKERGKGIRFKVKAISETALISQHESYIYISDNRFCSGNFIDERYGHSKKEYIRVIMDIFPDGNYKLLYFWVKNSRYMVEKTLSIEPRASFTAGGIGIWHKVDARLIQEDNDEDFYPDKSVRRPAALFWELNKWFVVVSDT